MDTDVEVYKPLDEFLNEEGFTGFEAVNYPSTATLGAEKGNPIIKKMMDFWINKPEKRGYDLAIQLKNNNHVIGIVSADKSYKYKCFEIGYSLCSKYFGCGYTTEAVKAIIDFLFNNCNCDIIEAIIPSKNIASIKVAEKCGLTKEAVLKNRYKNKVTGELNDLCIYSVFK